MKPIDQAIEVFDRQYQSKGLSAQRRYPNESLIQFLASRYFRDHSVTYEHSGGEHIDAVTVDHIVDASLPRANNGPVSFASPALARLMYQEAGLRVEAIERVGRTYPTGLYVEYLAISAEKN